MTLGNCPERPELKALVERSIAEYNALSPVDRALHDMDQKLSFVRGQMMETGTPATTIDANLDAEAEFVLAAEVRRLRSELSEARKEMRERAAKVLLNLLMRENAQNNIDYGDVREAYQTIYALSDNINE